MRSTVFCSKERLPTVVIFHIWTVSIYPIVEDCTQVLRDGNWSFSILLVLERCIALWSVLELDVLFIRIVII
jgi:hypothetical protein